MGVKPMHLIKELKENTRNEEFEVRNGCYAKRRGIHYSYKALKKICKKIHIKINQFKLNLLVYCWVLGKQNEFMTAFFMNKQISIIHKSDTITKNYSKWCLLIQTWYKNAKRNNWRPTEDNHTHSLSLRHFHPLECLSSCHTSCILKR